jgi:hypothetical protein
MYIHIANYDIDIAAVKAVGSELTGEKNLAIIINEIIIILIIRIGKNTILLLNPSSH